MLRSVLDEVQPARIDSLIANFRESRDYYAQATSRWIMRHVYVSTQFGFATCSALEFSRADPYIRARILARIIRFVHGKDASGKSKPEFVVTSQLNADTLGIL